MSEGLADVTVGPLVGQVAVVGGVRHRVGALGLRGAVLRVVQVEAVADVAEEARRHLLLPLGHAFVEPDEEGWKKKKTFRTRGKAPIKSCSVGGAIKTTSYEPSAELLRLC